MKFFRYFLYVIGLLVLLAIGYVVLITTVYEDKLKSALVKAVNSQLRTPVVVGNVSVSVLQYFPDVAVSFEDVMAKGQLVEHQLSDTLLAFEEIALRVSVFDLIDGNYRIKRIDCKSGQLNIELDKQGNNNYTIWQVKDTASASFFLELQRLAFYDAQLRYGDFYNHVHLATKTPELLFRGAFSSEKFDLDLFTDSWFEQFKVGKTEYLSKQNMSLDVGISIDKSAGRYSIHRGKLAWGQDASATVKGDILEDAIALAITADDLPIASTFQQFNFLPQKVLNRYGINGRIGVHATVEGPMAKGKFPEIKAQFTIAEGRFKEDSLKVQLQEISATGEYNNPNVNQPQLQSVRVEQFAANWNRRQISGNGSYSNFAKPQIAASASGNVNLTDLISLFGISENASATGSANFNGDFKWKLNQLDSITKRDWKRAEINVEFSADDVALALKEQGLSLDNIAAKGRLANGKLSFQALNFSTRNNSFETELSLPNFWNYLFVDNQDLQFDATVEAEKLLLEELLANDNATKETEAKFNLPTNLQGRLDLLFGEIQYQDFLAKSVASKGTIKRGSIVFYDTYFGTLKGEIGGRIKLNQSQPDKPINLALQLNAKRVDIKEAFRVFDNFGQKEITHEHMNGTANLGINLAGQLRQDLKINPKTIYAKVDLDIIDGELNNYKSLQSIPNGIRGTAVIRRVVDEDRLSEELASIKFKRLTNQLEIKNQQIAIPSMLIQSTTVDVNVAGTHSFDNIIDYAIDFRLSDVMKKKDNDAESSAYIDQTPKEGLRIYLTMKGPLDNPKIKFKKLNSKKVIKNQFTQEKKETKQALRDEFGWFKSDTSLSSAPTKTEPAPKFEVTWEEEDQPAAKDSLKQAVPDVKPKKKKKSFLDKVLKPDSSNGGKKPELDFEDDDY